ncbi:hypothetical protein M513_07816 [Trichuris suis]|nr:hypothetical protein M513_07816 [Trichuris suis]
MLASYDVKDLFTSIPLSYTYNIIFEALNTDPTFKERTKLNPCHIVDLIKFRMTEGNGPLGLPVPAEGRHGQPCNHALFK